ncbi:hypothetical protein IMCC3317_03150 [Kordia antarctica]|uniref:HTH araC/xylS-type domain-containing protein n=1 Tax=Kordia antarctica TaxID=1218801 RepID=A0A7L4ZEL7_9FLAO|nr:helix-turn-helix domain-containing protein [Kordia antarctica]QHI34969.1 hypothetical protein IMCC3317_03150 [Kordia antarctica]
MLNFTQYCYSPFFKIFILLFYFSTISSAFSQTDSLATKSYDELVGLYSSKIGKNPEIAIVYMQKAHQLAKQKNDTKNIAKTLYGIAFCNFYLTNNSKALQDVEMAIEILSTQETKNSALLSHCYNLRGMVFSDIREDSKALDSYLKAKQYSKNLINKIKISTNIAFIKKMHKDYKEAIRIFKENLLIVEESTIIEETKRRYEVSILANITETYLIMNEATSGNFTKEARYYNDLALQKYSKNEDTVLYYFLLINEMMILFEEGAYDKSIELAQEIVDYVLENNDENSLCMAYFYIGKNYAKLKEYNRAILFFEKANGIIQNSQRKYPIEKLLNKELALSYTAIGKIEKGQEYFDKYITLVEAESLDDVKVLNAVYAKNDIPELRAELDRLKEIILSERKKKQQLYLIAFALVLVLIISFIWYRKKVKKIKQRITEVLQKVSELERVEAEEKNKVSIISEKVTDEKAALLLEKLEEFEDKREYLSLDCSLSFVAEKLESNTSYVSNLINNYKNKTFKSYITELRINTALIRLKNDGKLRSYTIKAIAEEFGFKRQETFSKAFKSQTGIYPSQYLKKLREDLEVN